jgi:hypothetical protein
MPLRARSILGRPFCCSGTRIQAGWNFRKGQVSDILTHHYGELERPLKAEILHLTIALRFHLVGTRKRVTVLPWYRGASRCQSGARGSETKNVQV